MRKLLLLLLFVSGTTFAQTITNKKGQVFDIASVESGDIVEYNFWQQGVFVDRSLSVNGVDVFKFKNVKKLKVLINGKEYKAGRNVKNLMLLFFTKQGFTVYDGGTDKQNVRFGGNAVYIANTNSLTVIKD